MANTALVSVRMPAQLVSTIDEMTCNVGYMNRSFIINHLLSAIIFCSKGGALQKILDCYDPVGDGISVYAAGKGESVRVIS